MPATLYEVGADSAAAAATAVATAPRATAPAAVAGAATSLAGAATSLAGAATTGALPLAGACASVAHVGGTDALLASRLTAGDDYALAEAFDRFGRAVYGAALRVVGDDTSAQDVVQDVFVELWSHPDRYDPAVGSLRTYLVVMARHRAVDLVRSELRRIARQERHHRQAPAEALRCPGDEVLAADTASTIRDAVRLLPDGQRRVVELAYFEGLSYREVALAAGIPEGTAKSRLRLALAKLESVLDRELLESP